MSDESLARYPYVIVRIRCDHCSRRGAYRLARLAEKYGAGIALPDLLARLTADCPYAADAHHPYRRICQAHFPDLEPPRRPPNLPPAARVLKVVQGGKG